MAVDYATRAMGFYVLRSRVGHAFGIIYECQPRCWWSCCGHHCPGLPDQLDRLTLRQNKLGSQDWAVLLRASYRYTCESPTDVVVSIGVGGRRPDSGNHWIGPVQQARFSGSVNQRSGLAHQKTMKS